MQIDRDRLTRLASRETAAFERRTPRSSALRARAKAHLPNAVPMCWMASLYETPPIYIARGEGARFFDIDGNGYCDFNVCDLSMTMGYGPEPIARAVARQMAEGAHYLLPTEAAVEVAEELSARTGLPFWQFTTTASAANVEVMRVARALTGRRKIVVFDGHYHGHVDETLSALDQGRARPVHLGGTPGASDHTVIVPFNDLDALSDVLAGGDVALVLAEPALTNILLVHPDPGFWAGARALCLQHGALLCLDEAHTFQFAFGGLARAWQLESDFIVLGKGLGTGISFALYGMSHEVGTRYAPLVARDFDPSGVAAGGTTYASALAIAAAQAALTEVLTPDGYDRLARHGAAIADGLDAMFDRRRLDWRAFRLGPRTGYCLKPDLPRTGAEAAASLDLEMIAARRVFMANRGVWEAISTAGTQVSFAHERDDLSLYLDVADAFLDEVIGR
jgi:glutamate-1-semialdehyde 2,1-aminomutase